MGADQTLQFAQRGHRRFTAGGTICFIAGLPRIGSAAQRNRVIGFERQQHHAQDAHALGLRLAPLMAELTTAQGPRRVELFARLFGELCGCRERRALASVTYLAQAGRYMSSTINLVLAYIKQNITLDFASRTWPTWRK